MTSDRVELDGLIEDGYFEAVTSYDGTSYPFLKHEFSIKTLNVFTQTFYRTDYVVTVRALLVYRKTPDEDTAVLEGSIIARSNKIDYVFFERDFVPLGVQSPDEVYQIPVQLSVWK